MNYIMRGTEISIGEKYTFSQILSKEDLEDEEFLNEWKQNFEHRIYGYDSFLTMPPEQQRLQQKDIYRLLVIVNKFDAYFTDFKGVKYADNILDTEIEVTKIEKLGAI